MWGASAPYMRGARQNLPARFSPDWTGLVAGRSLLRAGEPPDTYYHLIYLASLNFSRGTQPILSLSIKRKPCGVPQVDDMSSARLTLTPQLFWAGAALLHASRADLFLPAARLMVYIYMYTHTYIYIYIYISSTPRAPISSSRRRASWHPAPQTLSAER